MPNLGLPSIAKTTVPNEYFGSSAITDSPIIPHFPITTTTHSLVRTYILLNLCLVCSSVLL